MTAPPIKVVTYSPRTMPTLGSDQLYYQQELAAISNAITSLARAVKALEARLVAGGL
jgi:hypothetical protein